MKTRCGPPTVFSLCIGMSGNPLKEFPDIPIHNENTVGGPHRARKTSTKWLAQLVEGWHLNMEFRGSNLTL